MALDPSPDPTDLDAPPGLRPLSRLTWRDRIDDARDRLGVTGRMVVAGLVVALAAAVAWWLLRPPAAAPIEARIPLAGESAGATGTTATTSTTIASEVVVQAAGAVQVPGVYRLPAGSRVDDLVTAAGGLTADADPDRVNLAAPVSDGERVWLPHQGDLAAPEVVAGATPPSTAPPNGSGGTGPTGEGGGSTPASIDLNTATAAELEALPGVGPATAAAIVAHRDAHGPFSSVDGLLDVRGIGEAKLEQIRPMATV